MAVHSTRSARDFVFRPTPAVAASRARNRYVDCAVCGTDSAEYLFHRVGVRFVRCASCGLVYTNPVSDDPGANYFDIVGFGHHDENDRANLEADLTSVVRRVGEMVERADGRRPRVLWIGRWFAEQPLDGADVAQIDREAFDAITRGEVRWLDRWLERERYDVVVFDEVLEASSAPAAIVEHVTKKLPDAWIAVTYANTQSLPARTLRRYWPRLLEHKRTYFSTNNVVALMARFQYVLKSQFPSPTHVTLRYGVKRVSPSVAASPLASPLEHMTVPIRVGNRVALFKRGRERAASEKLSIVLPVYNEAGYVRQVIEAILAKELPIAREVVIVESNSTDGTREIVAEFAGRDGVTIVYEDEPRGKGHAVRAGLAAISGTIVLIQDADFEYDIDDYDALLAPILQRKTSFVLGSRSLGLDDWKVRQFEGNAIKRWVLNSAQVGFAKTFNLLYQQNTTDVNTMFKVFRAECLDGVELEGDRFSLDIELVCKLVRNGYSPFEVPINYVARGFEEGKKISFVKDALPSYFAFFRYRFGS